MSMAKNKTSSTVDDDDDDSNKDDDGDNKKSKRSWVSSFFKSNNHNVGNASKSSIDGGNNGGDCGKRETNIQMIPKTSAGTDSLDNGFNDPELERLYKSYSLKQKFNDFKYYLYMSNMFHCYTTVIAIVLIVRQPVQPYIRSLITITLVLGSINMILIFWCKKTVKRFWSNRFSKIAPILAWASILFAFSLSIFLRSLTSPLFTFEDFGWIFILTYFVYVSLPLTFKWCVFLTICGYCSYFLMVLFVYRFSFASVTIQLVQCILLMVVVFFLGRTSYFMQEEQKRRAFVETKRTLEMKMVIEAENYQQERLLLSVLPKHVAVQMRQNLGAVDSQFKKIYLSRHENVSILYADIVGFTAISSTYSAQDLVKILNELFARFDRLAEKFYQLRIKILGDCYYCISGAPEERADHAVLCIHMGLSMVDAIKYVQQKTNSPVDMRVGIHTGAILAGVLGQRQWQFDVYSKDVELANHMESSGMAGRVHISEKTLSYLNDEFEVEPGFGEKRDETLRIAGLKTYFIVKVLKPLQSKKLSDKNSRQSDENEFLFYVNRENSFREAVRHDKEELKDFRKRLENELLYKNNERDFEKHIDPILFRFKDKQIEKAYYRQAGIISRSSLPIFLVIRMVISTSHVLNFQKKLMIIPFGLLCLLLVISLVFLTKLKLLHDNQKTWIWTIWNIIGITMFNVFSLSDSLICYFNEPTPTSLSCKNVAFFSHSNILELIAISQSEMLGFLGKTVSVLLFVLIQCISGWLLLRNQMDADDFRLFRDFNQTNSEIINQRFQTKYVIPIMTSLIAISLILLVRHWERIARLLFSWRSQVEEQRKRAVDMRHKNETLLFNVLPPHVASYFMSRGGILHDDELYSQSYSEVGVLFASMPNFSDFYSEETVNNQGLECLRFLNEVISDFDALLEEDRFKKHVTKIKTISSSYMAASGLNLNSDSINKSTSEDDVNGKSSPEDERWSHLSILVEFALQMKKVLQNINEQSFNHFVLKMGINHGPVTAGVIGARKPHYDIWGNTVNVASRMESTGRAGSIQVTKESCEILEKFGYQFEQRGLVHVKGKGQLMTYYLIEDN